MCVRVFDCVCVCVRACVRAFVRACVRVYALRIFIDSILRLINTLYIYILHLYFAQADCGTYKCYLYFTCENSGAVCK